MAGNKKTGVIAGLCFEKYVCYRVAAVPICSISSAISGLFGSAPYRLIPGVPSVSVSIRL